MEGSYYCSDAEYALNTLKSSEDGLSETEFMRRLEEYGPNIIRKKAGITPYQIFVRQFTSFIVLILLAAVVISFLIGEVLDSIVILIIVLLNAIFGFVQEYRAEKAIEALRKLTALKARVVRGGKELEVDSKNLVPGDIILLGAGDKVPADARLIHVGALQIDEASLTGESVPSPKILEPLDEGTSVTDQENMAFMGTIVTKGHGKAVVTDTGMNTEMGKIAHMIQQEDEKTTPLQDKLKRFGEQLGLAAILICAIVFLLGSLKEYSATGVFDIEYVSGMFFVAVALAVAAVPEGLPAVVTVSLAFGVRRMAKRNALVRKLPSVETLGCTDVICSDKTGTLTKNEMTVKELYTNSSVIEVTGKGYAPKGEFKYSGKATDKGNIELLLRIGTLCNDSSLNHDEMWGITGDPTEGALLVSAAKWGLEKKNLEGHAPRVDEIPFDSKRKCMTTVHEKGKKRMAYTKGAPDIILSKCKYIFEMGKTKKLDDAARKRILEINRTMANRSLRVLGFAYKQLAVGHSGALDKLENDLVFVGLQAMIDPAREEVRDAIAKCKTAGIRTVVITGDHKLTAIAITKELGIFGEGDNALSGEELDKLSDEELDAVLEKTVIYARVSPEHKVRVLNAFKRRGHVVAMTGDGVNDAPALKKSDVGIAMGITGTDVAKEASDIVLTDDNFASIVNAVEEGRGIYNSISQFVQYTVSSNLAEVMVIFLAILVGWPLPLLAIQILWVNLLTDGLPGLALGLDPFDKDIMKNPPRKRTENIITKDAMHDILLIGFVMGLGTLFMFYSYGVDSLKAKSVAFTTLVVFQLFNVLTYRTKNFWVDVRTSKFVIGSVAISILMQIAVLYTGLNVVFKTVPLGLSDWAWILLVSCTVYLISQSKKMLLRRRVNSVSVNGAC
ncbi:MAG: calcium-translocating P-type ATPase, SERCA-type [Candidatus Micrarchaeota archaeon]